MSCMCSLIRVIELQYCGCIVDFSNMLNCFSTHSDTSANGLVTSTMMEREVCYQFLGKKYRIAS